MTSTKTACSGLINCRNSLFRCRASTLAKFLASVLIKDVRLKEAHSWGSSIGLGAIWASFNEGRLCDPGLKAMLF